MNYKIKFLPQAKKEWDKLDSSLKTIFKKQLKKVQTTPHIFVNSLRNLPNCYKIKLRSSGYRLVYEVEDETITVYIISIGKRDKLDAYKKALKRVTNCNV